MAAGDLYFGQFGQWWLRDRAVTVPRRMQIHPRPFGQVLGDAVNGLGRTWRTLARPALLAFIPAGLLTLAVFEVTGARGFLDRLLGDPGSIPPGEAWAMARPLLEAVVYAAVIQAVATVFVYLATHRTVAADLAGEPLTAIDARRHALRRWLVAMAALVIAVVGVAGLFLAGLGMWTAVSSLLGPPAPTRVFLATALLLIMVTPAIWLAVSLSMITAVVSLEGRGPLGALQRSFLLVRGRWLPTLGYLLLVGLLGSVAIQLIQMVAIPLSTVGSAGTGIWLAAVIGIAAQGLIVAGMAAMYTGWYVDLRARQEVLFSEGLLPTP